MVDAGRLKDSFAQVARHGDQVPLFFYSYLFLTYPETRGLFPVSMAAQRDKLVTALGRIVSDVDKVDELGPFLQQLGRDHRKFAVVADHYPAVGASLLATLDHFLGPAWTPELAADWRIAYELVASVMTEAAEDAARILPPWWDAEVRNHQRRSLDVAVLDIQPEQELDYAAGQSLAVATDLRPRLWRYYSPANIPRPDGTIELHVRLVAGGPVSGALVHGLQPGDVLRLGAPVGNRLTLAAGRATDLVLLAGGTGLAPLKALVEQVAAERNDRRVHLFIGARTAYDLYDLPAMEKLAREHGWLTVTPAASQDPRFVGERGMVVDVALRHGDWRDRDIYVCGSAEMVRGTLTRLAEAGIREHAVHYEDFGSSEGGSLA